MKYLALLIVAVVGCSSSTSVDDELAALVTQQVTVNGIVGDTEVWDSVSSSIVGKPPLQTITLFRMQKGDTVTRFGMLQFTVNAYIAGTHNVYAQFLDSINADTVKYAGDGKVVVSELVHMVTSFNIRVSADTFYTNKTILFLGHVRK